jgi:hypothetical protein
MAPRTSLWTLLPWLGGINTSAEPALIPENQCQNIENAFSGLNEAKAKRKGIDKAWDGRTTYSGSNVIIGGSDFHFYSDSQMQQTRIAIDSNGAIRAYDPDDGSSEVISVSGVSLASPTIANVAVINSLFIAAMDKSANRIKKISGDMSCTDLLSRWGHTTISRSSSGTTRTIVLGQTFKGAVGDYIVASGLANSDYNGTCQVTAVSTTSLTNDTIAYTGTATLSQSTTADTGGTIHGLAPNGSFVSLHQGSLLTNEKTRNYRLHYTEAGQPEIWGGYGGSGAIDFDPGDNDPEGVTAAVSFQGDLYVWKKTKMYRVRGYLGIDHTVELISSAIGCIGQEAITTVDQTDVIWASERGVHSLSTTQKYGDVESSFVSKDIQYAFNGQGRLGWSVTRRKYTKVRYLPNENAIFFATTERRLSGDTNNCLWILNTNTGQWDSRWPDVSCETIFVGDDSDRKRIYCGSETGHILQTFSGNSHDTTEAGVEAPFVWKVKTGKIAVDKNFSVNKAYKALSLLYTPTGTQVITASVKVDGFPTQSYAFPDSGTGTPLRDHILGVTLLGSGGIFGPRRRSIVGSGKTIEITLVEAGATATFGISGIVIEYQPEGLAYQTDRPA